MGNRSFIAAITISLILISTVGGALVTQVARANPVPWQSTPNQEKPTLTVQTPQNGSTYNGVSDVLLNFTVTKPSSWDAFYWYWHYIGEVDSVDVSLDGNLTISYSKYHTDVYLNGNRTTYRSDQETDLANFSVKLNQTAPGQHTLNVTTLSYTYYKGPLYSNSDSKSGTTSNGQPIYQHPIVVSDIVYFTLEQPTQTTSPPPSTPESPTWIILPITMIAIVVAVLFIRSKNLGFCAKRSPN